MRRGLGLVLGAGLVAGGGAATSLWGCLEDLPEAQKCPSAPVVEGKVEDCFTTIGTAFQNGYMLDPQNLCLVQEPTFTECYRGPGGCACNADTEGCATPGDGRACFPSGDCPPKVIEQYPSARCVTLEPDDIGPGLQEGEQCLCGCEHCMSVCDGRGPVWAQFEYWTQDAGYADLKGFLAFDVRRHMPTSGRLGVYIRARGAAAEAEATLQAGSPGVAVTPADSTLDGGGAEAVASIPFQLDDRFSEVVVPSVANDFYSWSIGDDKPGLLVIYAGINTFTLMEIDCVVPFVIE